MTHAHAHCTHTHTQPEPAHAWPRVTASEPCLLTPSRPLQEPECAQRGANEQEVGHAPSVTSSPSPLSPLTCPECACDQHHFDPQVRPRMPCWAFTSCQPVTMLSQDSSSWRMSRPSSTSGMSPDDVLQHAVIDLCRAATTVTVQRDPYPFPWSRDT